MATPVFDDLNVRLAYLLGDPYTPGGGVVSFLDDGIAYPAAMRDKLILTSARRILVRMGPLTLLARGRTESYVRRLPLTSLETPIPSDCVRIYNVELYGKRVEHESIASGRLNSVYWQNTPMYRIEQHEDSASRKLVLLNVRKNPFEGYLTYLRGIPDLAHGGTEDLLLDSYLQESVLDYAEVQGRRNHQEAALSLRQMAHEELQQQKESE